jgi:hypothetical protein
MVPRPRLGRHESWFHNTYYANLVLNLKQEGEFPCGRGNVGLPFRRLLGPNEERVPKPENRDRKFDTPRGAAIDGPELMGRVNARLGKARRLSDFLLLDRPPRSLIAASAQIYMRRIDCDCFS